MRKLCIITIILIIVFANVSCIFAKEIQLTDIGNHWAKNEINILLRESVIQGYDDGTFKPDNEVTVSEFLKMVIEMADYKLETIGEPWPDWYIQTALKNNLISGNEFDDYSKNITRYEAVKILSKYINIDDVSKSKNIFIDLKKDEKEIILKLVNLKVISGYSDSTFKSANYITRAEACKIISNAYNAKQNLLKTRKYQLNSYMTNLKELSENNIANTYQIKNNRIYIYDIGKYANINGQTLNQEYVKDKTVIKLIENLIGEEAYVELKFVPDKYIINNLNVCYGYGKNEVENGNYIFEIRFYENAYYDVGASKNNSKLINDACIKIKTGKMWDKFFEKENYISCSEKNLYKLKESIGIILDKEVEKEFIEYFIEKRIEANKISNSEEPKISETKKIGKYTINTFCMTNNDLEFYIQKF